MSACSERQLSQVKDYDDLDHPTKSLTDYDYESQELVNLAKTNYTSQWQKTWSQN